VFLHLDTETGVGHFLDRRDAHIRVKAELLGEPTILYALKVYLRILRQIQHGCRVWMTTEDTSMLYENGRCLPAGVFWRPLCRQ